MLRGAALTILTAAVIFTALRWGSFVAGGSDSACYAIQAVRWAEVLKHPLSASLQPVDPLALSAPWPGAALTFAPTGHVPSRSVDGAFVPICPAGLSIAMAPLYLIGGPSLMFVVVPLFGIGLVLATYALGARFNTRVGIAAACLTTASPVFLYQVVQPMSDVPAAALWVLAVGCATGTKRRDVMLAGIATSLAVLMRPNLVPLGFATGVYVLLRPERSSWVRLRSAISYALWSAPGCVAVALVQNYFYGSPFASGYGSFTELFAVSHVMPNLTRYASWLWQAQTPAIALAILAPVLLPGTLTALLLGLFVINLALFLPYVVFNDWSFTRFLLPTVPMLLVVVAAVLDGIAVRVFRTGISPGDRPARMRPASAAGVVVSIVCALLVQQAISRRAFELRDMEQRFSRAGRFVAERLPADALVITDYESGSVPFYSGRRTFAWRALDPAWLDRAIAFARDNGFEPYLLFERWEEPEFRARFADSAVGRLDWPPMAEVATQVRVYRVSDRDRYRDGFPVPTEYGAMRIAVFGAGGVGAFFGALLVRGGGDVHFIARGAQLAALRERGILIRSLRLGDVLVRPIHAESDAALVGPCDLVLVCVKAHQTPQILDDLALLVTDRTMLVTLQNGVESDEPLAARFGRHRVVPAVVYVGATVDAPGVVSHVAAGTIAIGVRDAGAASRLPAVAAALEQSGQPVKIVDDIQAERWRKLLWNASFNPVSAITQRTPRDLAAVPSTRRLLVELMGEVIAVAAAQGVMLDPAAIEEQLSWTDQAPAIRTSMMVDRSLGRGMEIDALVGVVVRKGREGGVPTPFSESMLALLEAIVAEAAPQPPAQWVPPPVHH